MGGGGEAVTALPLNTCWTCHLHVGHLVVVEVGGCREPLPTGGTLVGLLAAVDPAVSVERGAGGEPLAAHLTHVGLLTCTETQHTAPDSLTLNGGTSVSWGACARERMPWHYYIFPCLGSKLIIYVVLCCIVS